jgi:hypothetical protein
LFISETKSYVTYVDAAGEVMTAANMVGIYNLAIDGAFRARGFDLASHMPFFYERMEASIGTFEELHEGLFLGFPGRKMKRHAELKAIWEENLVSVTEYLDTSPPTMTTVQMSLWDLGAMYIAAARQVSFLAQVGNASTPSLDSNRFWLFVRENGPNALTAGYLKVRGQWLHGLLYGDSCVGAKRKSATTRIISSRLAP